MPGRKDEGVSEVISFVLILAMLIVAFSLWAIYAVPAGGEQMEEVHNVNVQLQFSDLKTGIENVWLSNSTGVIRESVLMLGPDISESGLEILSFPLTRASGTLRIEADESNRITFEDVTYSPLVIRYVSANAYVEDMDLLYWGGDGSVTVSGSTSYTLTGHQNHRVMVRAGMEDQILSGQGRAVVEYRMVKTFVAKYSSEIDADWHVFEVSVR